MEDTTHVTWIMRGKDAGLLIAAGKVAFILRSLAMSRSEWRDVQGYDETYLADGTRTTLEAIAHHLTTTTPIPNPTVIVTLADIDEGYSWQITVSV